MDFNESNFYLYRSLCFDCLRIDYDETHYLHVPKENLQAFTNFYPTLRSKLLANVNFFVYDYESFLVALHKRPNLFKIYEIAAKRK